MRFRPAEAVDAPAIDEVIAARASVDERAALTEHKSLTRRNREAIELVATNDDGIVGYAIAAQHGSSSFGVELVTLPDGDEREAATGLLVQMQAVVPTTGTGYLWAWRPNDRWAAEELGLEVGRVLATMERRVTQHDAEAFPSTPGITLRSFKVGQDEEAWLDANKRAFSGHPETAAIDRADLRLRMEEPWFDPRGFLLAERRGEIVGYCWTKLHPEATGEIYIIGVVPEARGVGLGQDLLDAGLADLAGRQGARCAMLYMDGSDDGLRSFYERRGFVRTFESMAYVFPAQPNR